MTLEKIIKSLSKFLILSFLLIINNVSLADNKEISWDDLVPNEETGVKINTTDKNTKGIPDISDFGGSKEELNRFLNDMKEFKKLQKKDALINTKFDGSKIKIPGYIVPLTFDGDNIIEFLLVPNLGACIHVPPPPANQIIYIKSAKGLKAEQINSAVWVSGMLNAKSVSTIVANVGYTINEASVTSYSSW